MTTWEELTGRIAEADLDALGAALAELDAAGRAAMLALAEAYTPPRAEPEPVVLPPLEPEPLPDLPANGMFAFVLFGDEERPPQGDPEAFRAWMARRRFREREREQDRERQRLARLAVDRARALNDRRRAAVTLTLIACTASASDVVKRLHRWEPGRWSAQPDAELARPLVTARGVRWCTTLANGMARRARSAMTPWPFTEALLRAVGADLPDVPAARARYVTAHSWGSLSDDPYFDQVWPYLFDEEPVAVAFAGRHGSAPWVKPLVELSSTGRVPRAALIAGCLRRLRAPRRPGLLTPYLTLLSRLAPTAEQLAAHRQELVGLLTGTLSTVAAFAHDALLAQHHRWGLEPAVLAEMTASMLTRTEKKLVRSHLALVRTMPIEPVLEGLLAGLHHPEFEFAEAVLDLIERDLPILGEASRERLAAEVLDTDAGKRLATLLGTPMAGPAPAPLPLALPPAAMPPPLDLGGLAGELADWAGFGDRDPVRVELVLEALVRLARTDRDATGRALGQMRGWWARVWATAFGGAVTGVPTWTRHPLGLFCHRRLTEVLGLVADGQPADLLAVPATTAGQVDPARVLALIGRAERDGRTPPPADLAQALMRLPEQVDADVRAGAARLSSPAGRALAACLDGRLDPLAELRPDGRRSIGLAAEESQPAWPLIAPARREVIAAHVEPFAAQADGVLAPECLGGLAAATGECGPAMASTFAFALANGVETTRLAAADAIVTLAAQPSWDPVAVGAQLGSAGAAGRLVLRRVVQPLTEAQRAGAHEAVAAIATTALPALLAAGSRPGLPEFVTLAGSAVRAGGGVLESAALAELAARPGKGSLVVAARRALTPSAT